MRARAFGILIAGMVLSVCAAASPSDEDIVRQFYPEQLTKGAMKAGSELNQWSFTRVDLDRSGHQDYLAVAYGNGISGAVRVIKAAGGTPRVVSAPAAPSLLGLDPQIQAVDVNGDGIPELIVSYTSGRSHRNYDVFAWKNGDIAPIGDSFVDADFVDLDGDGKLEVVEPTETHGDQTATGTDNSFEIFTLADGTFSKTSWQVPFLHTYLRKTSKPFVINRNFSAQPGSYVLRVANGTSGNAAVDSGVVTLNGKVILGPDDFKSKRKQISVPVDLVGSNQLSVEIRSVPGSGLSVFLMNQ